LVSPNCPEPRYKDVRGGGGSAIEETSYYWDHGSRAASPVEAGAPLDASLATWPAPMAGHPRTHRLMGHVAPETLRADAPPAGPQANSLQGDESGPRQCRGPLLFKSRRIFRNEPLRTVQRYREFEAIRIDLDRCLCRDREACHSHRACHRRACHRRACHRACYRPDPKDGRPPFCRRREDGPRSGQASGRQVPAC
jgi:hypothetical protein